VTALQPELAVDPVRVINILKARLVEEITKTAMTEAALQESQGREAGLVAALQQEQAARVARELQDDPPGEPEP
jgi:hypothetical protein